MTEDGTGVHAKMLETEYVQQGDLRLRNVSDYIVQLKVFDTSSGQPKALEWELGGEHTNAKAGNPDLHIYWEWAE